MTAGRAPSGWIAVPPQLRGHLLFCPTVRRAAQASRVRGWRVYRLGADPDGDPTWAIEPALPVPGAERALARLAELAAGADDDPPTSWISHPLYQPTSPPTEADLCPRRARQPASFTPATTPAQAPPRARKGR
jgi:hypothetical protein